MKKISYNYIHEYVKQNAGIKSVLEMSVETNVSTAYLNSCAKKQGVSLAITFDREENEKVDELIREHGKEMIATEIAKLAGVGSHKVRNRAYKMGFDIKKIKLKAGKVREERDPNFFYEHERENWLI